MDRIAVLADVHGNLPALEVVAADISRRGISEVVNLGDHVSGPLWPRETADLLMRQTWRTIAGNHDRQVAFDKPHTHGPSDAYAFARLSERQLQWLASLPPTLSLDDRDVLLVHGTPQSDTRYLLESIAGERLHLASPGEIATRLGDTAASLVACGHSHVPRLVHDRNGRVCLNPGSVGLPAYRDDGETPHVSETGSPQARYAVAQRAGDAWRVEFVALDYDWIAAARQAGSNSRPDWEDALRTGYVG